MIVTHMTSVSVAANSSIRAVVGRLIAGDATVVPTYAGQRCSLVAPVYLVAGIVCFSMKGQRVTITKGRLTRARGKLAAQHTYRKANHAIKPGGGRAAGPRAKWGTSASNCASLQGQQCALKQLVPNCCHSAVVAPPDALGREFNSICS